MSFCFLLVCVSLFCVRCCVGERATERKLLPITHQQLRHDSLACNAPTSWAEQQEGAAKRNLLYLQLNKKRRLQGEVVTSYLNPLTLLQSTVVLVQIYCTSYNFAWYTFCTELKRPYRAPRKPAYGSNLHDV